MMVSDPRFTVIVPAYNEAAVIGRTLASFAGGEGPTSFDIVVMCNGCVDDTAARARIAAPGARVIELAQGSKTAAINAGLELARAGSVLIVDADISIAPQALAAVAASLDEPGVMAAAPAARTDLNGCDRWVRAYYRVKADGGYMRTGVGGSGVYGLSRAGRACLGRLPAVIADDAFVRARFPLVEQVRVASDRGGAPVFATVQAPRTLRHLLTCEARWRSGDAQLRSLGLQLQSGARPLGASASAGQGAALGDQLVYFGIKIAGRLLLAFNRLRGTSRAWHRDASSRVDEPAQALD